MQLFVLISVVSCVLTAYADASEQNSITSNEDKFVHWPYYHVATNLANAAAPQLSSTIADNLRLFDNRRINIHLSKDTKIDTGSNRQENIQSDIVHKMGGNGFRKVYVYHNGGINGVLGQKREASVEPYFRFKAEKQLSKNEFVNGFIDLRRGISGHGVQSGENGSWRFKRETAIDEVEEEIAHRRRRDKILPLFYYIRC